MIYHPVTQYSEAWWILRRGLPTASGMDALLTPEFKIRTGGMPETYLYEKLAELYFDHQPESGATWAQDQGSTLEEEARKFLEVTQGWKITNGGFITDDAMRYGASPDGLIGDFAGLELKCPQPVNALRYVLDGVVPKDYRVQIQASLFISGRKEWYFCSYSRKLDPLVIKVEPDPLAQEAIREALDLFLGKLAAAAAKIDAAQASTKGYETPPAASPAEASA